VKAKTEPRSIKTTISLPEPLWRAAKIRAMDDRTDLRTVLTEALERYLGQEASAQGPRKGTPAK
jgi:hypothetical protein